MKMKKKFLKILISVTKNYGTHFRQTHTIAQVTHEIKMIPPSEKFSFQQLISIDGSWMVGLVNLEVYISSFNITEQNIQFEIYTDTFVGF